MTTGKMKYLYYIVLFEMCVAFRSPHLNGLVCLPTPNIVQTDVRGPHCYQRCLIFPSVFLLQITVVYYERSSVSEIDGVAHSLMILQKKIYVIPRVAHSSNVFYDMILMTAVNLVTGV